MLNVRRKILLKPNPARATDLFLLIKESKVHKTVEVAKYGKLNYAPNLNPCE